MKWKIDAGNSTRGLVGYVLRVEAATAAAALARARACLPDCLDERLHDDDGPIRLAVYFNAAGLTLDHVEADD